MKSIKKKWNCEVHPIHAFWSFASIKNILGHQAQNVHAENNTAVHSIQANLLIPFIPAKNVCENEKDDEFFTLQDQFSSEEINNIEGMMFFCC